MGGREGLGHDAMPEDQVLVKVVTTALKPVDAMRQAGKF